MAETKNRTIPFSGKWWTAEPASIGENFQTLKNLRYTDTHIKGVHGMSKINVTAMTTCVRPASVHHFRKTQPSESHIMMEMVTSATAATTERRIMECTATIGSTGAVTATALWTATTGAATGQFSDAPDGQMIYCNSIDNCIWGGNEMPVGALVVSTTAVTDTGSPTSPLDCTKKANNTKQDSDNVITLGGGNDSYTRLLLHCDGADASTTFTDSSTIVHIMTANGTAQIDSSYRKFGTGSGLFDGNSDYIVTATATSFQFGTGDFTIDFWVRFNSITDQQCFISQREDADNNISFVKGTNATGNKLAFAFATAGAATGSYTMTNDWSGCAVNTWYHLEFARISTSAAIFINGVSQTLTASTAFGANDVGVVAAQTEIGRYNNALAYQYVNGWLDEFRVSKGIARHSADFTVPSSPYLVTRRTWLIGSPRPLQGLKYYISSGNPTASTMTGSVWNGSTWQSLTLTDNTDTGASLAATGTVTFSSTVDTAKPKYLEGYFLYWYQFAIDAGEATIYYVTLNAPFQDIVDIWDGVFRSVARFYKYTTTYLDDTTKVLADDYYVSDTTTYSDLSSMAAFTTATGNNCMLVGFTEMMAALRFEIAPDYTNSTGSTVMSVDYWNGESFASVGTITDGTSEGGISFAKSGVVSWNNAALTGEALKTISNSPPLYFYRVRFNQAMDASVRVNLVAGVTAQKDISHYKFPVFAQGRVLLCNDTAEKKNKLTASSKFMPQVYNGADSVDIYFGEEGELICGTELFSQFGSNLYSIILMFKRDETWIMAGQDITYWQDNTFLLSDTIGCPAMFSLKRVNLAAEPGQGINRNLAIWQGTNGFYMSDGRAPIPIHGDIAHYFDKNDSRCLAPVYVQSTRSWIDPDKMEYHALVHSGSTTTYANVELVYDIRRNKWFEIDRGTALQNGLLVHDIYGNPYTYGFTGSGLIERLENGTDFDGTAITHTAQIGDIAFEDLMTETRVADMKLIMVAKSTTTANVTLTHYADGSTTGTDFTFDPTNSGYRLAQPDNDAKLNADPFHSFKFVIATNDETTGFEPIALSVDYQKL